MALEKIMYCTIFEDDEMYWHLKDGLLEPIFYYILMPKAFTTERKLKVGDSLSVVIVSSEKDEYEGICLTVKPFLENK